MEDRLVDSGEMVIEPENVLNGALELFKEAGCDQAAVILRKGDKFEIFSSHTAEDMENMIDDALDALYDGEIGFDDAE